MEKNNIAMRIRAFRKLKGFTQHELAHLLGVSIAVVGAMERGIREPDHHMIQSISHVLGIEPRELSLKYM